jgi:hypothetical protein
MADTPTFQPNPYANFDPSQWQNPYSQFYGRALPWPSSYAGTPTNALGQPIQPPPGMTLNASPAQPQAPAQPGGQDAYSQVMGTLAARGMFNTPAPYGRGVTNMAWQRPPGSPVAQPAAAPQAAAPSAPNNWQQTLGMLANPGPVMTPGATVPQAASSVQPSPGVLQSFLANWKPAASGPGSGFTQNFNTILRGLQGG